MGALVSPVCTWCSQLQNFVWLPKGCQLYLMLDLPELLLDTEYGNPGMGLAKNKAPTKIFDSPGETMARRLSEEYAQKGLPLLALRGSVKREKLLSWWCLKQHAKFCTLLIMYTP